MRFAHSTTVLQKRRHACLTLSTGQGSGAAKAVFAQKATYRFQGEVKSAAGRDRLYYGNPFWWEFKGKARK